MERADRLDFEGMKSVRKPRTFSSRKPKLVGSHTSFLNEQDHSLPSASLPLDPRNVVNSDKGVNDETGMYLESYSHGDDYKRRIGNSNIMGMAKDYLESGYRIAGANDDSVPEGDKIKRVRRDFADLNGKHLGRDLDADKNYDKGGSKPHDYEHSKSSEKCSTEKSHKDGSHYDRDSKYYSIGEKVEMERSRFSKTFKRRCNADHLDQSKRFHEGGMERKDSFGRHGSHEILEHDHDSDRDQDRDRDGSLDVQGSMKSSKGGASGDWCKSDGHKVLERRSLDFHNPSHVTGGMHFEYSRLLDGGSRAEGRTMDNPYVGHSKSASEGPSGLQIKTATAGRTFGRRYPDAKSPVKSVLRQDDLPSQEGWLTKVEANVKAPVKSVLQQDDLPSQEGWLTKVKPNVGGVTHTAHANSTDNTGGIKKRGAEGSFVSAKPPRATEGKRRQRLVLQENSDDEYNFLARVEIQESPKEKPQVIISASTANKYIYPAKEDKNGQLVDEVTPGKQQAKLTNNAVANQPIRKSSRMPKKRILDGEHYVDDDGEQTLQRKSSRSGNKCVRNAKYDEDGEECEGPQRQSLRIPKKRMLEAEYEEDDEAQQHKRRWKRSKYQTASEQLYQEDAEEAAASDNEDAEEAAASGNEDADDKKDVPLTARQKAMQSCKDTGSEVGANLIEYPEGLPQTSRRKRKEKLSEVEQQLQKTEAAQRRKMQLEKAANEAQAEAIKKILGKNPSRKNRDDKRQKQRDAMTQKKAAIAMLLASNSVRTVMGPSGTVVSFPEKIGLPSIFNSPCRYPPPREKCAGPLCNNTYKYRDSKTHLPLCSLQCYRAIQDA